MGGNDFKTLRTNEGALKANWPPFRHIGRAYNQTAATPTTWGFRPAAGLAT